MNKNKPELNEQEGTLALKTTYFWNNFEIQAKSLEWNRTNRDVYDLPARLICDFK